MKYLMIVSIGPVQDFISTARRSRDLWYGSWMLSELSKVAARKIVELSSLDDLIFPHPANKAMLEPESDFNAPNKIVASITTDDPKIFVEKVIGAVRQYLEVDLAKPILNEVSNKSKTFNRKLAEAQIADLLELYWVSVPYDKEYDVVRAEAEALLVARKTTRDFKQMLGANVPKSSLDGSRESVIVEDEYPKNDDKNKEQKIRKLYDNYHARQGERLSGVDLLKRMGNRKDEPDFKSTSHMAALPFIEKLNKKWGEVKTKEFINSIRQLFVDKNWNIREENDGALLYESRLTDWIPAGDEQKALREKFNQLLKINLGDSRPSPYYALLAADGDFMGKVIDAQKDVNSHRELSEALSDFAAKVKPIVEKNGGLLIYSGGDDVLAYLPINKALDCANELEKTFKNAFREDPNLEDSPIKFSATKDGVAIPPTLSIGIVIAHHLDPLSDVLEIARSAEKKAKEVPGKNGLAITLSKRAGVDRTIKGKWKDLSARLTRLIEYSNAGAISGGTAYELQELYRTLAGHIPDAGLEAEAVRIVKHKQVAGGGRTLEEVQKAIQQWVKEISLDELANQMIIAKALADTTEQIKQEAQS